MNKNFYVTAILLLLWTDFTSASFAEKSNRYFSPKVMFTLLQQKFPVLAAQQAVGGIKPSCWTIGGSNTNVTGLVNPAIGLPANTEPGAGFVRWWGSCIDNIVAVQFQGLAKKPKDEKLWSQFWSPTLLDRLRDKTTPDTPFHKLSEMSWSGTNDMIKDLQIRYLIEEWIGPNPVIRDLGFTKGTDELVSLVKSAVDSKSTMTFSDANQKLILAVMLREEFLSY